MPQLILRYAFVSPSLQVRFKSVHNNGTYMGFARDLHRNYLAITPICYLYQELERLRLGVS